MFSDRLYRQGVRDRHRQVSSEFDSDDKPREDILSRPSSTPSPLAEFQQDPYIQNSPRYQTQRKDL